MTIEYLWRGDFDAGEVERRLAAGHPRWQQIAKWVRTSYTLVAPRSLARQVRAKDGLA